MHSPPCSSIVSPASGRGYQWWRMRNGPSSALPKTQKGVFFPRRSGTSRYPYARPAFQARRGPSPSTGPAPRQWAVLILPRSASGPDASYSLCEGCQNKASIFAIVCSVLKCSFVLEVRDKRDSWVAAFVATWVAPVPCQPPAGRHRHFPGQNIIFKILFSSGSVPLAPTRFLYFLSRFESRVPLVVPSY